MQTPKETREINPNHDGVRWEVPLRYFHQAKEEWEWAYRVFIYGFGIILGYLGVTDTQSLMFAAGQQDGGFYLICFEVLVSLAGILDLVANRGGNARIKLLEQHRHFILLLLAFCFFAMLFVAYGSIRSGGVGLFYFWPGVITMAVALSDARKRGREQCSEL